MKRIVVPTKSGADWKRLLAKPDLHWKPGKSAMSAAASWEAAGDRFPSEVSTALAASKDPDLAGQAERLKYLHDVLQLEEPLPDPIRYQLLHRTASAILTAQLFHAQVAIMLVQSFSPVERWREDFHVFCRALGVSTASDSVAVVQRHNAPRLFVGWCKGDQRF